MSVEISHSPGVAWVTFGNGRGNVLDSPLLTDLAGAVERVATDSSLKLIVFEGAGVDFSFGASVEEHRGDQVRAMFATFHGMFRRIDATHVPTAAVVRGRCLGGGLEFAAFCGHVACAPNAVLALPEVRLGVFPPLGAVVLPWRCGGSRSTDLITLGGAIPVAEALAVGLVDEVADDPAAAAWAYSERFTKLSASSVRHAWTAARLGLSDRLREDLPRLEGLYLKQLLATHDAHEGIAAYLERRPPAYVNR